MKKTKILVFGQTHTEKSYVFWYYNGNPLEQVTLYISVSGNYIPPKGLFQEATKALSSSALKVVNNIFAVTKELDVFRVTHYACCFHH